MSSSGFLGTWEVYECRQSQEALSFKGIRFCLDPRGDVTWYVPEELKSIALFNTKIYDITSPLYSPTRHESSWVRFGEHEGEIFEFETDQRKPKDTVIFQAVGLCTLYCKRVPDEISEEKYQIPFTLLPALEEGFFSDITIVSSDKREFKVHSLILNIIGEEIDWHSKSHPLSNLSSNVLDSILHYMYTECLPENLSEEIVQEILLTTNQHQFLKDLSRKCQTYLKNESLKKKIVDLVNEIHDSLDRLIEHIRPKHSLAVEYLIANPDHLCYMIRNCIRDAGVCFIKLIDLCDLYHQKKPELTTNEQYEIVQYGKSRFFVLVTQLTQFFEMLKGSYGSMNPYQKNEIATFLVPEVSGILDMLTNLIMRIDEAIQRIAYQEINDCRVFCHMNKFKFLKKFCDAFSTLHELFNQKRRSFMEMSNAQKVRSISLNIEEIIDEMPAFLMVRLEELMDFQDKVLAWRDFKFFFQTCTSKISKFTQLMASRKSEIREVAVSVCEIIQRDTFNQSLQNLGIIEPNSVPSNGDDESKPSNSQKYTHELNLVESFCVPPKSDKSLLSKNLLEQFRNTKNTDMVFEIVNYPEGDCSEESNSPSVKETGVIEAHRVVVASRCDWFRKALLSGMKEDIDKKIVIHETNPETFKIFLEYLYTGKLNASASTQEQLVDLVVLSDRFEVDSLKQACETALEATIDTDNAIYLLSLADSYNAKTLKVNCLDFIAQHQELSETDLFYELHSELQAVIFDHIWTKPVTDPLRPKKSGHRHNNRSYTEVDERFSRMNMHPAPSTDSVLELCLSQMREVIGEEPPRDQLVQVILAADYDPCRAINYYYAKYN